MDFSKKYLLKYGWEEGKGLGKMKDGIKTAIRPKLKFDKAGMGYDPSLEFTDSWWVKVYNDALTDANVKKEEITKDDFDEDLNQENLKNNKRKFRESSFTDLFEACEGRTVHKGARQGLRLGGKLQRLEQQELHYCPRKKTRQMSKTNGRTVKSSNCISAPTVITEPTEEKQEIKKKKKNLKSEKITN